MGDRANIVVPQDGKPGVSVYLYTHWNGAEMPQILQAALRRGRGRWTDQPYLTRIIFSEMIKGSIDDETGYGISAYIGDNGRPFLVVDTDKQEVRIVSADDDEVGEVRATIPFEDYIKLPEPEWQQWEPGTTTDVHA